MLYDIRGINMVDGIGITGTKYPSKVNGKTTKEYDTWRHMLKRCYNEKHKEKQPTYKDVACCQEWLYYPNFYEWIHSQENFDKWYGEDRSAIDKDILVKCNKLYSPDTCCLVPQNVNSLFTKRSRNRGELPIGVSKHGNGFRAECKNPFTNKQEKLGTYPSLEQAFQIYKSYKENLIKQVAQTEFSNGNIIEKCYNAMMNYIVEITD